MQRLLISFDFDFDLVDEKRRVACKYCSQWFNLISWFVLMLFLVVTLVFCYFCYNFSVSLDDQFARKWWKNQFFYNFMCAVIRKTFKLHLLLLGMENPACSRYYWAIDPAFNIDSSDLIQTSINSNRLLLKLKFKSFIAKKNHWIGRLIFPAVQDVPVPTTTPIHNIWTTKVGKSLLHKPTKVGRKK